MWEKILHPFVLAIAWLWAKIHDLLAVVGFGEGAGIAWVLSIVLLTLLVRALILPLFLRQIRSTRGMAAIQPEMQKIQAKYKGKTDTLSRQRMAEETQALYKKHGTTPYASCLPLLVQMPILFALYRAIYAVKPLMEGTYTVGGDAYESLGPITRAVAQEIDASTVLGVPLSHTISTGGDGMTGTVAFVVMIVIMVVVQFLSIRLSMTKNMAAQQDPNNPMVRSQKTMMYMMPLMYIFTGAVFQMGLLVYMVTTTFWSWGQQIWTVRFMPTPGSPAYAELLEKRERGYKEWAKPFFADYDRQRAEAEAQASTPEAREAAVAGLDERTLAEARAKAKAQHVNGDFPEEMTTSARVSVYRNLSLQEWTTLPDEQWMRGVKRATEKVEDRRAQQQIRRQQPRRQSHEERRQASERAEEERRLQEARAARKAAAKPQKKLSEEEIQRRREERRRQRRQGRQGRASGK
jgi:YidC/Oxa1 family membrane protein insertase